MHLAAYFSRLWTIVQSVDRPRAVENPESRDSRNEHYVSPMCHQWELNARRRRCRDTQDPKLHQSPPWLPSGYGQRCGAPLSEGDRAGSSPHLPTKGNFKLCASFPSTRHTGTHRNRLSRPPGRAHRRLERRRHKPTSPRCPRSRNRQTFSASVGMTQPC